MAYTLLQQSRQKVEALPAVAHLELRFHALTSAVASVPVAPQASK